MNLDQKLNFTDNRQVGIVKRKCEGEVVPVHVTKALTLALDKGQLYFWPLHSRGNNRRQS
jgi:hypothetical protein